MTKLSLRLTSVAALALAASGAMAAIAPIDVSDPANGLTDIYSATFDGNLVPCSGSSPSYCSFFGGDAPAGRQIVLTPNPTGVANAVPGGIAGAGLGSFLNLTPSGSSVTFAGGTIAFPAITLTISGSTVVTPSGVPGFVFDSAPQVTTLNADGQAEFLVNLSPGTAADFSTFADIVLPGDCTGSLCALIPILSLDMNKYRLFVDYDPTFTSFSANLIGQTGNNSLVFATLNSAVVPLPAAGWLLLTAVGGLAARRLKRAA